MLSQPSKQNWRQVRKSSGKASMTIFSPKSLYQSFIRLVSKLMIVTRDSNRIVQGFVLTQSPDVPVWCSKDVLPVLVKTEQNQK